MRKPVRRIERGIQLIPGSQPRALDANDIAILNEELEKDTVEVYFTAGQEWKRGERVEIHWHDCRFIVSPL